MTDRSRPDSPERRWPAPCLALIGALLAAPAAAPAQSSIRVGHLGPREGEADRHAPDVMNRVLGGGTASR